MLKEAFEYLFNVGRDSTKLIVKADAEPSHIYFIRQPDGTLERTAGGVGPMNHKAGNLDTIIELAKKNTDGSTSVWFSPSGVTLVFDDRSRANLVFMDSDPLKQLKQWKESRPALTQQQLIQCLKTTFRDSLSTAGELVAVLSKVKFTSGATIDTSIGHGKASLGKEIVGEVTGTKAIPEYVTFTLSIFANPCLQQLRKGIECALIPDPETGTFRVVPLPGQIENAVEWAVKEVGDELQERLDATKVPVLNGSP